MEKEILTAVPVLAEPEASDVAKPQNDVGEARESTKSVRSSEIPAKADSRGGGQKHFERQRGAKTPIDWRL